MLGVIVVDHGSRVATANADFEALVSGFAERCDHPIVEPAHMELAEPSIDTAFGRAVARGATRLVVHPYFLSNGRHVTEDIPALCTRAAALHGGLAWQLTAPIGESPGIYDAMVDCIAAALD